MSKCAQPIGGQGQIHKQICFSVHKLLTICFVQAPGKVKEEECNHKTTTNRNQLATDFPRGGFSYHPLLASAAEGSPPISHHEETQQGI